MELTSAAPSVNMFSSLDAYLQLVNNCDEKAPLLSATRLGRYLDHVPLHNVQPSDLTQLHQALNVEQLIGRKDGLARDYRGLAELMGFNSIDLEARFKRSYNPTKCLIDALKVGERGQVASVTDLLKYLEKLERFDVLDDFLPTLIRIAAHSENCQQVAQPHSQQVIDRAPASSRIATGASPNESLQYRYDAFLCYALEDSDYAQDVLRALENNDKRIVTVDNLLAGQFEYDALVQMIALDCRKVIIILTPNFLESKDCDFQAKFANEIAIKDGWFPKIIPILYEPLDDTKLSPMIRVISKIDMTRAAQRDWQLRKLLRSLEYDAHSLVPPTRPTISLERASIRRNGFQPDKPSITEHSNSQANLALADHDRLAVAEPIVDLAQSQCSSADINCSFDEVSDSGVNIRSFRSESSQLLPTGSTSLGAPYFWKNWYRSFKSKVRGPSAGPGGTSTLSKDVLLTSTSDVSNQTESPECPK